MMFSGRRLALIRRNGRRKIVQAVAERPESGLVAGSVYSIVVYRRGCRESSGWFDPDSLTRAQYSC
jgi:hypothetical protein